MDQSRIEGVKLDLLKVFFDDRGAVLYFMKSDSIGFDVFGECYFSEVNPGIVKAWKKHLRQIQNITVPVGKIQLVLYDDRPGISSFGQIEVYTICRPEYYYRITIPPGVWHGFKCMSDTPALLVNCANMKHDREESISLPYDDKSIPFNWGT